MKRQITHSLLCLTFFATSLASPARAGELTVPAMPQPGVMVDLSPAFTPAHLKGISIHPDNALTFDFIVHKGDGALSEADKKTEYNKLIKYFLASLAVPDKDQWVNLSPYEHNRIVDEHFGRTEMGRDLLAQDYLLKQITSSLIYPEKGMGKKFWDDVYAKAGAQYGKASLPVNTFNKVWIMPDKATIYEKGNTAYVLQNHLKVMLEEDYLALRKHGKAGAANGAQTHTVASKAIRDVVLPALEQEVNTGKNFAPLRQVYASMLLAAWYKRALKESLLGKVYADKSKVAGVDQPACRQAGIRCELNEGIYQQYLEAFKKGVFNYVKEETNPATQQVIPRKYFSGGATGMGDFAQIATVKKSLKADEAMAARAELPQIETVVADVVPEKAVPAKAADAAMRATLVPLSNDIVNGLVSDAVKWSTLYLQSSSLDPSSQRLFATKDNLTPLVRRAMDQVLNYQGNIAELQGAIVRLQDALAANGDLRDFLKRPPTPEGLSVMLLNVTGVKQGSEPLIPGDKSAESFWMMSGGAQTFYLKVLRDVVDQFAAQLSDSKVSVGADAARGGRDNAMSSSDEGEKPFLSLQNSNGQVRDERFVAGGVGASRFEAQNRQATVVTATDGTQINVQANLQDLYRKIYPVRPPTNPKDPDPVSVRSIDGYRFEVGAEQFAVVQTGVPDGSGTRAPRAALLNLSTGRIVAANLPPSFSSRLEVDAQMRMVSVFSTELRHIDRFVLRFSLDGDADTAYLDTVQVGFSSLALAEDFPRREYIDGRNGRYRIVIQSHNGLEDLEIEVPTGGRKVFGELVAFARGKVRDGGKEFSTLLIGEAKKLVDGQTWENHIEGVPAAADGLGQGSTESGPTLALSEGVMQEVIEKAKGHAGAYYKTMGVGTDGADGLTDVLTGVIQRALASIRDNKIADLEELEGNLGVAQGVLQNAAAGDQGFQYTTDAAVTRSFWDVLMAMAAGHATDNESTGLAAQSLPTGPLGWMHAAQQRFYVDVLSDVVQSLRAERDQAMLTLPPSAMYRLTQAARAEVSKYREAVKYLYEIKAQPVPVQPAVSEQTLKKIIEKALNGMGAFQIQDLTAFKQLLETNHTFLNIERTEFTDWMESNNRLKLNVVWNVVNYMTGNALGQERAWMVELEAARLPWGQPEAMKLPELRFYINILWEVVNALREERARKWEPVMGPVLAAYNDYLASQGRPAVTADVVPQLIDLILVEPITTRTDAPGLIDSLTRFLNNKITPASRWSDHTVPERDMLWLLLRMGSSTVAKNLGVLGGEAYKDIWNSNAGAQFLGKAALVLVSNLAGDKAMFTRAEDAMAGQKTSDVGGIDMNAANVDLTIKRDGKGVPLPLAQQDMAQLNNIRGFVPNILEIRPAMTAPSLSELRQDLQTAAARPT